MATKSAAIVEEELITEPGKHVLCGRGGHTIAFQGNVRFRMIIEKYRDKYNRALSKSHKACIAAEIVKGWRKQKPPGRFLIKVDASKGDDSPWKDIGDRRATKKTLQCLRERVSHSEVVTMINNNNPPAAAPEQMTATNTAVAVPQFVHPMAGLAQTPGFAQASGIPDGSSATTTTNINSMMAVGPPVSLPFQNDNPMLGLQPTPGSNQYISGVAAAAPNSSNNETMPSSLPQYKTAARSSNGFVTASNSNETEETRQGSQTPRVPSISSSMDQRTGYSNSNHNNGGTAQQGQGQHQYMNNTSGPSAMGSTEQNPFASGPWADFGAFASAFGTSSMSPTPAPPTLNQFSSNGQPPDAPYTALSSTLADGGFLQLIATVLAAELVRSGGNTMGSSSSSTNSSSNNSSSSNDQKPFTSESAGPCSNIQRLVENAMAAERRKREPTPSTPLDELKQVLLALTQAMASVATGNNNGDQGFYS